MRNGTKNFFKKGIDIITILCYSVYRNKKQNTNKENIYYGRIF